MKTPIKTVLVLLLSVMTFFSCSKDDDNNSTGSIRTQLVGTWEGYLNDADDGNIYTISTYNSDGTGTLEQFSETIRVRWEVTSSSLTLYYLDNNNNEYGSEELTYTLEDNKITVTDDEGDVSVFYRQ